MIVSAEFLDSESHPEGEDAHRLEVDDAAGFLLEEGFIVEQNGQVEFVHLGETRQDVDLVNGRQLVE